MKQRKRGRPPSANPMVHTAVVLPRALLNRLKADAESFGQGLSTVIRRRLQLTYDLEELRDPETNRLIDAVTMLADNLAGDLGRKWYQHPYALAAFKAGVAALLAEHRPKGNEGIRPDTRVVGNSDDPAEVVGRTHARLIQIARGSSR
jgi:hypothetical protein